MGQSEYDPCLFTVCSIHLMLRLVIIIVMMLRLVIIMPQFVHPLFFGSLLRLIRISSRGGIEVVSPVHVKEGA